MKAAFTSHPGKEPIMRNRKSSLLLSTLVLFSGIAVRGEIVKSAGTEPIPYRQFVTGTDQPGEFALVLFLHGAGERGNNNESQLVHGSRELLSYCESNRIKAVLLFPQCPEGKQWVDEPWDALKHTMHENPSEPLAAAMRLLDQKTAEFKPDRIYAVGLSMGGYGVWELISRRPEQFTAALAICGGGDVAQAPKLVDLPILAVHGSEDTTVPVSRSRDMVRAIWNAGGTRIIYQELPGVGHGSWGPAFGNPETWKWLFSRKSGK